MSRFSAVEMKENRAFEAALRPKLEAEVEALDEAGVSRALAAVGARLCSRGRTRPKLEDLRKLLVTIRLAQAWSARGAG